MATRVRRPVVLPLPRPPADAAPAADTAACASCGNQNPAGAKFCANCGQATAPKVVHCTECGTELAAGAKFCMNCGTAQGDCPVAAYSHSMVPGGLDVTSSTTRFTSRTSLVMRVEIRSSTS